MFLWSNRVIIRINMHREATKNPHMVWAHQDNLTLKSIPLYISRAMLLLLDSVAAPRQQPWQRPEHFDKVPAKNNERRRGHRPRHHEQVPATHNGRCRGKWPEKDALLPARRRRQRPGAAIKYFRRTTSAAAGNGLGTTMKSLHGAAGFGLGTTIKYLRRATGASANYGLGTTIKYLVNQNSGAGTIWAKVQVKLS